VVIDIHTHTQVAGAEFSPEVVDAARRAASGAGIDKIVYLFNLGTGGRDPSEQDIIASNDLGMRLAAAAPEFFIGFCYLNPAHDPAFTLAEMDRCIMHGNMRGVKLWVAVHATDARLDPIMERAAQLGVPVLHHSWYKSTTWAHNESSPAEIAHLARRHPDTTIIMAHLAGVRWRGVLDIKDCPNVLVDTSGGVQEAGLVEYAVRELGPERVVFGSDWPLRNFAVQKARVTGSGITQEQKELILGKNAVRILKLNEVGGCDHV
jgi:predicted TIM-barrel fold metal-dependent hydrolase